MRDIEGDSNPKAFTVDICTPDLSLPEIINVVRDWWACNWVAMGRLTVPGGALGTLHTRCGLFLLPLLTCSLAPAPTQTHFPGGCFQHWLLAAPKGTPHILAHTCSRNLEASYHPQNRCLYLEIFHSNKMKKWKRQLAYIVYQFSPPLQPRA